MKKQTKILFIYMLMLLLSVACDDSTTEPEQLEAQTFSVKEIEVPEALTQSGDTKAITVNAHILSVNSIANIYGVWFTAPGGNALAKTNDGRTFTWTRNGVTITMEYTENDDEIFRVITISGSDGEQTFTNYKFLESKQKKDKSEGYLKIFDISDGSTSINWVWNTTADNVYSMNFTSEDGDKIEVNSNPNKSGIFSRYENNVLVSKIVWTIAGGGEWWEYDDQGNVTSTGTWNPPA